MALVIEADESGPCGLPALSVAYYGEQNGDLMRDPEMCFEAVREACYGGFGFARNLMLCTGEWGWHAEAGLAALRLILAGNFDRHPELQIILGHWGEMLVSFADRTDALTKTTHLERRVLDYITGNIYATPGGVFSHRMMRQILDVLGPNRIMFAVDDPFNIALGQHGKDPRGPHSRRGFARAFIETAPISRGGLHYLIQFGFHVGDGLADGGFEPKTSPNWRI